MDGRRAVFSIHAAVSLHTLKGVLSRAAENLEILSLARNSIKRISGLEEVGSTLKQLWLSYNQIEKLDGLQPCVKLEVLFISNNRIKSWDEVEKLVRLCVLTAAARLLSV